MMKDKLKLWDAHSSWEEAEAAWEKQAQHCSKTSPLKTVRHLPDIPGITPETSRYLRWKSLSYLLKHDTQRIFWRYFFKHPFKYTWNLLKSYTKKKAYLREGDFFLYGFSSLEAFEKALNAPLVVIGFSYCHKPLECPSGRFTDQCVYDETHPVCRQCFIGKSIHALPSDRINVFLIPTVHYIGEQFFKLLETHSADSMVFLITACEMTLEMFADWGHMLGIQGVGIRLDGRICNTMKAFELSERGIKPGLTVVLPETQQQILNWIRTLREKVR